MTETTPKAEIGVTGLAVMGSNLARNFARNGFVTAVHNRSYAKTKALIDDFGGDGTFVPSESSADFVASLAVPRKILIMVKAGGPTDAVIDELGHWSSPATSSSTVETPSSRTPAAGRPRCRRRGFTSSGVACPAARRAR